MQSTEDYNITFEDKYCSAKTFERKCTNGIFDGPETDIKETCIDGGGPICRKIGMLCHSGESCEEDTDCYKGTCDKKKKTCTTCKDGIRNGAETDVDCGTGKCPKCTCCHLEFSIVSEDSHTGKITPKNSKLDDDENFIVFEHRYNGEKVQVQLSMFHEQMCGESLREL